MRGGDSLSGLLIALAYHGRRRPRRGGVESRSSGCGRFPFEAAAARAFLLDVAINLRLVQMVVSQRGENLGGTKRRQPLSNFFNAQSLFPPTRHPMHTDAMAL